MFLTGELFAGGWRFGGLRELDPIEALGAADGGGEPDLAVRGLFIENVGAIGGEV